MNVGKKKLSLNDMVNKNDEFNLDDSEFISGSKKPGIFKDSKSSYNIRGFERKIKSYKDLSDK